MKGYFVKTDRLGLQPLDTADAEFIFELVNTKGWLTFIGDRNVHNLEDAKNYLQRILQNPNVTYWVVKRLEDDAKIGIITYIKRDYLAHHDIGFAFLPEFSKSGYAYEASRAILNELSQGKEKPTVLATTKAENGSSIKLLEKLGLYYDHAIEVEGEPLLVFSSQAKGHQATDTRK
ncbi:GNAT family N-acetyltransferase [Flavobacterium sp.]|uniref:GNAT family N-acetyltransferase n=1 Tax=Flavobacterium sp. TaxID=239 RepID=UPI0039E30727